MTAAGVAAAVTAHQGGWDEALLVAGPIVAIVGLLMLAKERVDAAAAAAAAGDAADDDTTGAELDGERATAP